MPLTLLKNVNFGRTRANLTGSTGVSYQVLDVGGGIIAGPSTAGVYQVAPGIYAANITYPDNFHGQTLWTCPATGSFPVSHAVEQYNVEENDPKVADTWNMVNAITGTIYDLYDMGYGRWKIDKNANQMIFYRADNTTEVARYNLFDDNGTPTFDGVFERQKV